MGYRQTLKEDYEFTVEKTKEGGYKVFLPHQCDEWEIIGFDGTEYHDGYGDEIWEFNGEKVTGTYRSYPIDKNTAISQLELFIKRASEALERLKKI